ncbi:hypothetical protein ANCCEY_10231 [Ancylostoma ceylanicum]|uniref:Choline/carnitine acyltransferase domain-containing protein n=1 Tax=Ancylostoma ceylanicum TaxID=53326 RepID=A0A0D6LHM1_9BILA|nr:hypothetical protein ANCCEY_10231 [Ancylostoma ceylanicum]
MPVARLTKELDLGALIFNDFGRDFIKENKFSPYGFVQLALQLAHFKVRFIAILEVSSDGG